MKWKYYISGGRDGYIACYCPECGKDEQSDEQERCAGCGARLEKDKQRENKLFRMQERME